MFVCVASVRACVCVCVCVRARARACLRAFEFVSDSFKECVKKRMINRHGIFLLRYNKCM